MSSTFEIGDNIPLSWLIEVAGVPTNATVALTVTAPDGTASTPTVSSPSTGSYTASITATQRGTYGFRWVATGAVVAAESGTFDVGSTYCTLAALKVSLDIDAAVTTQDEPLRKAIEAASRAVDDYTGTTFGAAAGTSARTFRTNDPYAVWIDAVVDISGLVVKTGTDGTFPTTIDADDVIPWPHNAAARGRAVYRLDVATGELPTRNIRPTVQVTARWGWPTVPTPVAQATLLKAARLFRRKDAPEGLSGGGDFGVVRFDAHEDGDVLRLLAPYAPLGGVA